MATINSYKLVNATDDDCNLLFQWANDREVRLNSFNSEPIEYDEHIKWFNNKLQSKDSIIYIFKVYNENVGLIRLDKIQNNTYLINYSIAKEHRGKGYAIVLLNTIKQKYKSSLLIGKVKKENTASIKAFIKSEYIIKEELDMYVFYSFIENKPEGNED